MSDFGNKEVQRARLEALYATYNDDALCEINPDDLTDVAKEVLEVELQTRDLHSSESNDITEVSPIRLAVWEGETMQEAELASNILVAAGIAARVSIAPNRASAERFQVTVASPDAERALGALDGKPIATLAKEILADLAASDFVLPSCNRCGSARTVLIAIDPTNRWSCEECGDQWLKAPSHPSAAAGNGGNLDENTGLLTIDLEQCPTEQIDDRKRLRRNRVTTVIVVVATAFIIVAGWAQPWAPPEYGD